jgi:cobalt-zinc-cadmium efflux system outer membrane protein
MRRLLAVLFAFTGVGRAAAGTEPLTLAQIQADVRAHNPQLRAAAALAAADRERIHQAASREDAVAGLELMRDSSRRLSTYDTAEFSVRQKIPITGNREARRAVATAEADVTSAGVRSREFVLLTDARDAYFQLWSARTQLALIRESDRLLGLTIDLLRGRAATGQADANALLAAGTERTRLHERQLALEREAADAAAKLNTLRDLPAQQEVGELATPADPTSAPLPPLEELQARALAHRPEIAEAEARLAAAREVRRAADRAWRPDPELMLKARHANAGSRVIEGYDTGLAVSLPWFNDGKYRSTQREADRRREAAELDAASLRTRTAAEIRALWQEIDTTRRTLALYREQLLPAVLQTAENLRTGLITGKTTVAEFVTARRQQLDVELAIAASTADLQRLHAMMELFTRQS